MPYCSNTECWRFAWGSACLCNDVFCHRCVKSHFCSKRAKVKAIDTHIHLADKWREGEGGLPNVFLQTGACRELSVRIGKRYVEPQSWNVDEYLKHVADGPIQVTAAVFVECLNVPALSEAQWALKMCAESNPIIVAVVAHIPVPEGSLAVNNFLNSLRSSNGSLPTALKGGRVVLLDDPMPPPNACLTPTYLEGLAALSQANLLWEWCCVPAALPYIAKACAQFPNTTFVLDHLGHNEGGDDLEQWKQSLSLVAANPNVYAKLGAIEEWGCKDPAPYLDFALSTFGIQRCLYESNWFVSAAAGVSYGRTAELILEALSRIGASSAQVQQVFCENARHVYSLTAS